MNKWIWTKNSILKSYFNNLIFCLKSSLSHGVNFWNKYDLLTRVLLMILYYKK
jgi:hypothetical protein